MKNYLIISGINIKNGKNAEAFGGGEKNQILLKKQNKNLTNETVRETISHAEDQRSKS